MQAKFGIFSDLYFTYNSFQIMNSLKYVLQIYCKFTTEVRNLL